MSGEQDDASQEGRPDAGSEQDEALARSDVRPEDLPSLAEVSASSGSVGSPPTTGLVEPGTASTEQADDAEPPEPDQRPEADDHRPST